MSATKAQQYVYFSIKPFWNVANGCLLVKYQSQSWHKKIHQKPKAQCIFI